MSELVPADDSAITPGGLMKALTDLARDPNFDATKFRALADLQIQMEDRQAERLLTRDLHEVQRRIPAVPKRGVISLGKGKGTIPFATLPDVMKAAQPLLDEFGMTIVHTMMAAGEKLIVRTIIRHPAGASMSVDMVLPVDTGPGRNTTQAHMSTDSYGQRRGAKAILNIQDEAPADDDGSSAHYKVLTEEQVTELAELLKTGGASEPALLSHFYGDRYRSLDEAPASDYGKLKQAVEARNAAAARKKQEQG